MVGTAGIHLSGQASSPGLSLPLEFLGALCLLLSRPPGRSMQNHTPEVLDHVLVGKIMSVASNKVGLVWDNPLGRSGDGNQQKV